MAGEEEIDAGIDDGPADGGQPRMQFLARVDSGSLEECSENSPEIQEFLAGLPSAIRAKVLYVLNGDTCRPVYLREGLSEECELPEVINIQSNVRFKGLMVILEDEIMDLARGELYYTAFNDLCQKYPDAKVKIAGLELKPAGEGPSTELQAATEVGVNGELLVRVHIWSGEVSVLIEGVPAAQFVQHMQALIRVEDGKVMEVFSTDPASPESAASKLKKGTKSEIGVPTGCNVPGGVPSAPAADPTAVIVAGLALYLAIRKAPQK